MEPSEVALKYQPMTLYKWSGAIPDFCKKHERSIKSALHLRKSSFSKDSKTSKQFVIENPKESLISLSPPLNQNSSSFYSIKYLGVTKGQIGILSKRAPIPHLSPLETCKDVPLSIINSALADRKVSSRLLSKLISGPTYTQLRPDSPKEPDPKEVSEEIDGDFPDLQTTNEYVIHTYARPKALVTVFKEDSEFYDRPHVPIQIPCHRVGISGWKLSRPKSSAQSRRTISSKAIKNRPATKQETRPKKIDMPKYHNEPYLKFLADKKKGTTT